MKHSVHLFLLAALTSLAMPAHAQLTPYSQDFEALSQFGLTSLSDDGWLVYGNVSDAGGTFLFSYGPFPAPNGGQAFCGIDVGQGGPNQGIQQLVVYSDYANEGHFNVTDRVESNVFQEQPISASDVGQTWTFSFDAKRGNIDGSSTALAFIKTIDLNNGFASNFLIQDMTAASTFWDENIQISITIDAGLVGHILQFGFLNDAENFEPSGIFYDNVVFAKKCGNSALDDGEMCDDGNSNNGDGCSTLCEVEAGFMCSNPAPPNAVVDPGFEAGTPNPTWTEASTNFSTPLCDVATCGVGGSSGPFEGDWWAFFGGITGADELASVEQSVVIPAGADTLTFNLEIPITDTTGTLNVLLDGNLLATYSEADGPFVGYALQTRNISGYADGNSHFLRFQSITLSGVGPTNIFVDDVRIFDRNAAPSQCVASNAICSAPALALPDNDPLGTSDSLTISGEDNLSDLNVSIATTHSWVGDLIFTLENVDTGTSVVLLDRPGLPLISVDFGCGNNDIDVVLDDAAGTAAEDACEPTPPAIGGDQTPNNPLSAFDGESLNGTWTITVSDNAAGDTGVLDEWCLIPETISDTDSDSDGVFDSDDNCTDAANPTQIDFDLDGHGNACDADFDQNCLTNFPDLAIMQVGFFTLNPALDLDGSGGPINFADLAIMKDLFFLPPGPSAFGLCAP